MRDAKGLKLDPIANTLDLSISAVREWIEGICRIRSRAVSVPITFDESPVELNEVVEIPYTLEAVVRVIEVVVVDESILSLAEVRSDTALSKFRAMKLCALALARKFDLDRDVAMECLAAIDLSSECVFVGASRRNAEGRLVFGSGEEKRRAKSLLQSIVSSVADIRRKVEPFVDYPDPHTSLPALDPWVSSNQWLSELPPAVFDLLDCRANDRLDRLVLDVDRATTGAHDEHRRNVAILARWMWEVSGNEHSLRNDGLLTPFMAFAATISRLYAVELKLSLLRSTISDEIIQGFDFSRPYRRRS